MVKRGGPGNLKIILSDQWPEIKETTMNEKPRTVNSEMKKGWLGIGEIFYFFGLRDRSVSSKTNLTAKIMRTAVPYLCEPVPRLFLM